MEKNDMLQTDGQTDRVSTIDSFFSSNALKIITVMSFICEFVRRKVTFLDLLIVS